MPTQPSQICPQTDPREFYLPSSSTLVHIFYLLLQGRHAGAIWAPNTRWTKKVWFISSTRWGFVLDTTEKLRRTDRPYFKVYFYIQHTFNIQYYIKGRLQNTKIIKICCDGTLYLHVCLYKLIFLLLEYINRSNSSSQEKIPINPRMLLY